MSELRPVESLEPELAAVLIELEPELAAVLGEPDPRGDELRKRLIPQAASQIA